MDNQENKPTRGTDSQHKTFAKVLTDEQIIAAWDAQWRYHGHEPCKLGHLEFGRTVEVMVATRCRVEGGNTNTESGSDVATTTSTVSAPNVQHIPANFTTHRAAWREAITACINYEEAHGTADQAAYWKRERAAYDRAFDRLLDNPEPVKAEGAQKAPEEVCNQQQIEWSHELQSRLMESAQQVDQDDAARNVMAEAACLLAALTGRTSSTDQANADTGSAA